METTIVYTVDSAKFSVGGLDLPITNVRLDLEVNSIPSYTVSLPPHVFDSSLLNIQKPGLLDAKNILKSLFAMADRRETCQLNIKLSSVDAGIPKSKSRPVELNLSNWVLTSVSMGTINVTSGYLISLQVYHPAVNLMKFGLFGTGYANEVDFSRSAKKGSNIIEIADGALEALNKGFSKLAQKAPDRPINGLPKPATVNQLKIRAHQVMKATAQDAKPSKYLKFDPGFCGEAQYDSLPLKDVRTKLQAAGLKEDALKYAIATSFIPDDTSSVWDMMIRASLFWGCVILPDYTSSQLPVCPCSPWLKPKVTVYGEQVHQLTFPAYDPNPILGVKCSVPGSGTAVTGTSHSSEKQLDENAIGTWCYIPQGVLSSDNNFLSHGKLYGISTPPWFESLQSAATSLRKIYVKGNSRGKENPVSGVESSLMTALYSCQTLYAAFMFQMVFKQSFNASFISPIMINDEWDEPVIPGRSISVKDGGQVAFNGYIVGVSHTFDLPTSRATSAVTVSYCRPDGGYKNVCEEGDANPLYKK